MSKIKVQTESLLFLFKVKYKSVLYKSLQLINYVIIVLRTRFLFCVMLHASYALNVNHFTLIITGQSGLFMLQIREH